MAARTISATDTLETLRTTFNALSQNDFGDIGTLDSGLSATSVIGAVNEIYGITLATAGFTISDGSTTQGIGSGETLTVNGTSGEIEAVVSATDTLTIGLPSAVTITTSVNVSTMSIATGSITDSTGTISFGDENLSTTGNITATTVNSSTIPSSETIVGRTTVDTLTNKTLTQPTINTPTIAAPTITSDMIIRPSVTLIFEGASDDNFETTLTVADPTADRTITLPNVTGTVITTGDTGTVSNTMLSSTSVTSSKFDNVQTLLIKDSVGSTLKTMYSPGS
jgi:hypothetical protein